MSDELPTTETVCEAYAQWMCRNIVNNKDSYLVGYRVEFSEWLFVNDTQVAWENQIVKGETHGN
jgi:hypothetical protein